MNCAKIASKDFCQNWNKSFLAYFYHFVENLHILVALELGSARPYVRVMPVVYMNLRGDKRAGAITRDMDRRRGYAYSVSGS